MNKIHTADSLDKLDELEKNSVHAIVTDPPYGLAFMGKSWDDFEPKEYQEWCETWARKAKRVLKPGGHMLAFSGNRTHHRLFSGVEDAGYEIRDTITWHYGSGFPKALDVSKSIDKQADAEREIGEPKTTPDGKEWGDRIPEGEDYREREATYDDSKRDTHETIPATDAAEKWDGFKTALKPATEYIAVARKPFDGTVAENIQKHGTGALNIDGTRIGTDEKIEVGRANRNDGDADRMSGPQPKSKNTREVQTEGRYPSNVIFDETQAHALDEEVGELEGTWGEESRGKDNGMFGVAEGGESADFYDNNGGGPSRYFYTSKATKAERTLDGKIENAHPTVKPTDLMEWLVTLVTAENQIVLDPFIGSGTTGMACKNKNRQFIGIEQNKEYADIARVRCGLTPDNPSVVRENDNQNGLGDYV